MTDSKTRNRLTLLLILLIILFSLMIIAIVNNSNSDNGEPSTGDSNKMLAHKGASRGEPREKFKPLVEAKPSDKKTYLKEQKQALTYHIQEIPKDHIDAQYAEGIETINNFVYKVAYNSLRANPSEFIPERLKDPIVMMSLANVEMAGYQDWEILWTPAIPSKRMPKKDITVETIRTFNIAEALKTSGGIAEISNNTSFTGPFQQARLYGISNNPNYSDKGIIYTSETNNIASDVKALEIYNDLKPLGSSKLRHKKCCKATDLRGHWKKKLGDRYNWNDATLTLAQKWEYDMSNLSKERYEIATDNIYSFTAYIGMNHNIGESVSASPDYRTKRNMCNDCDYSTIWSYIQWFGNKEVQDEFRKLAEMRVSVLKKFKTPPSNLQTKELRRILNKYPMDFKEAEQLNVSYEGVIHPARMMLQYHILENLYGRGGKYD